MTNNKASADHLLTTSVPEVFPECSKCDNTGYKDHASFALDPCLHGDPADPLEQIIAEALASRTQGPVTAGEIAKAIRTGLADIQPADQLHLVAWASPGQVQAIGDKHDDRGGEYIPLRRSRAGNFTMPLYGAETTALAGGEARPHRMPGDPIGLSSTALHWYLEFNFGWPHTVRESNVAIEGFKDGYRAALAAPKGPRYRHKKRGTEYEVVAVGELQMSSDLLVDGSSVVIYRGDDGRHWVRWEEEFNDGRFEKVAAA